MDGSIVCVCMNSASCTHGLPKTGIQKIEQTEKGMRAKYKIDIGVVIYLRYGEMRWFGHTENVDIGEMTTEVHMIEVEERKKRKTKSKMERQSEGVCARVSGKHGGTFRTS